MCLTYADVSESARCSEIDAGCELTETFKSCPFEETSDRHESAQIMLHVQVCRLRNMLQGSSVNAILRPLVSWCIACNGSVDVLCTSPASIRPGVCYSAATNASFPWLSL